MSDTKTDMRYVFLVLWNRKIWYGCLDTTIQYCALAHGSRWTAVWRESYINFHMVLVNIFGWHHLKTCFMTLANS